MENQKRSVVSLPIVVISLIVLIAVGIYLALYLRQANQGDSTSGASTYQPVKIKQLIDSINQYNGKKVLVTGKYQSKTNTGELPLCTTPESGTTPEVLENYVVYKSKWVISDQTNEIGVLVLGSNGIEVKTLPNFSKDQQITLKAIARATTVKSPCNKNISNKSIYLEIKAADINLSSKGNLEDDTVGVVDTTTTIAE